MIKLFKQGSKISNTQMALFVLIELLLIFGKEFSKFHLLGPLYLYDFLFIVLGLFAVIGFYKKKKPVLLTPIFFLIGLSLVYIAYSLISKAGPINYIVRQYALFVYLGGAYVIFFSYVDDQKNKINVQFIILMGIVAFALQFGYHLFNLIFTDGYSNGLFSDFNYYSLLGIMALFVFEAFVLVYLQKWWKWVIIAFMLFLSLTLGHHSSVILATLMVLGSYFFIRSKRLIQITLAVGAVGGILLLYFFVPAYFQDHNSLWRLIYWKYAFKDVVVNYYGILGHGFGVKYVNQEVMDALRTMIDSPWFEVRPEEQYITPMHNSFLTIGFHVGLVFVLLIFVPLKNAFGYFFNRANHLQTRSKDFLILGLIGVIVWTNFHVVLELPHSSAFFWLIYFTTIYTFNFENEFDTES